MLSRVFCRNLAISSFTFSDCFILSSFSLVVANCDGSMPGKNLMNTGSRSSMNGTMINTENGIRRNISPVVRTNKLCSRLVNFFPFKIRHTRIALSLISKPNRRKP
uniref:Uncharacterized protein n=1 Tax=Cacopsylla melanoneura TaxID=428564 RepID=A0A8D8RAP5_9HEMI